jgi:hypothetical protein
MERPCKGCGKPVVETAFGWGHLANTTFAHHYARPAHQGRRVEPVDPPATRSASALSAEGRSAARGRE